MKRKREHDAADAGLARQYAELLEAAERGDYRTALWSAMPEARDRLRPHIPEGPLRDILECMAAHAFRATLELHMRAVARENAAHYARKRAAPARDQVQALIDRHLGGGGTHASDVEISMAIRAAINDAPSDRTVRRMIKATRDRMT